MTRLHPRVCFFGVLMTTHNYRHLEAECVNQFWWNLVQNSKLGTQWQSCDQILKLLKFNMADGRHIGKCWKCYNSCINCINIPIWMKLRWSHPIASPTRPPWCGCHGNGRCLATVHWTFSCYERLEAECMNQFWCNLVHNNKLGTQWQSCDQILQY